MAGVLIVLVGIAALVPTGSVAWQRDQLQQLVPLTLNWPLFDGGVRTGEANSHSGNSIVKVLPLPRLVWTRMVPP